MSFKENLLDYCNNVAKFHCIDCAFRSSCDEVDEGITPLAWKDDKFELMRQYLEDYHTHLVGEMAEIESVLRE